MVKVARINNKYNLKNIIVKRRKMDYGSRVLIDEFMEINSSPKEIYQKLSYSLSVTIYCIIKYRLLKVKDRSPISK